MVEEGNVFEAVTVYTINERMSKDFLENEQYRSV